MHVSNTGQSGHSRHRTSLLGAVLSLALAAGTANGSTAPSLADIAANYEQSMNAELYSEAIDAQKRYIGVLLSEPGHSRLEWGQALDRLARAQLEAESFEEAAENFELAVNVIEEETNRLDEALAEPLVGLANAQLGAEKLEDSLDTFKRAIHVQQVNFGPHALMQAEVLDQMSRVAFQLGDYDAANSFKQAYTSVYRQNYADDYLKQVDALLGQALLLAQTGHMLDAAYSYRRIIADVEDVDGRR